MSMERNLKIYQAIINRNLKIKKIKKKLKPLSDLILDYKENEPDE